MWRTKTVEASHINFLTPKPDLKPFVLNVAETETIVICDDKALQIPEPDKNDHSLVVKTESQIYTPQDNDDCFILESNRSGEGYGRGTSYQVLTSQIQMSFQAIKCLQTAKPSRWITVAQRQ